MGTNRMKLTFFDDYWVDFRPGTVRRWFRPEYQSKAVSSMGYSSLIYDPELGKYRLFYEGAYDPTDERFRCLKLMESEDMVHFTPVVNEEGSDVIFHGGGGLHGATVLYDPADPDPTRRYKFCGMTGYVAGKKDNTVNIAFSRDGIHWENHPELVANQHKSDTLNKLYYNPCTGMYHLIHRAAYVDRRIMIRTSRDLKNWSEPKVILHPGGIYNDNQRQMQHYAMSAGWFDGIFYGLLWRFSTDLHHLDYTKMFGVMDAELTYSYDGQEFLYASGDVLMERPMAPAPGWAGIAPEDMCESADGQNYYILVGAYSFVHGTLESNQYYRQKLKDRGLSNAMLIYKIRKDGFCGLESVGPGGLVITKGMELLKEDLSFNVRAECGSVRFGIMNKKGQYLEGFSLDDCIPFEFDQGVDVRPRWKEKTLSQALNQQVRIVVELNSATLHAMSATARPYINMRQTSFSNPQGIFEE